MRRSLLIVFTVALFTVFTSNVRAETSRWRIVPTPKVFRTDAQVVTLAFDATSITADTASIPASNLLQKEWKRLFGKALVDGSGHFTAVPSIRLQIKPGGKPEGYTLLIKDGSIELTGDDTAGLLHAVNTFIDLLESEAVDIDASRVSLPSGFVRDWADLPVRGMDFQWCFLAPSPEFMIDTATALSHGKFNLIIPELGSQYKSEREATLFKNGKITREAFRTFVSCASERGVQVVPKMSVLGHSERGMVWPKPLADGPDLSEESNYPALFNVMGEYLEDIRAAGGKAEYFHVGMDEASTTLSANIKKSGKPGGELVATLANRVHDYLTSQKTRMVMYHDMLIGSSEKVYWREMGTSHADATESWRARPQIPHDVILDYWNYEAFPRYRTVESVIDEGYTFWLQPWAGGAVRTMSKAAAVLRQPGIVGTTWSESGYSFPPELGPVWSAVHTRRWVSDAIGATAEYSWNANTPRIIDNPLTFDPTAWLAQQYWRRQTRTGGNKTTAIALPGSSPQMKVIAADIRNSYNMPEHSRLQGIPFDMTSPVVFGSTSPATVSSKSTSAPAPLPWTIVVNDSKKQRITGFNQPRNTNDVILYTREYGSTTGTSGYGGEAVIKNGVVEYKSDWGVGNEPIPHNGFVISAHGEGLYELNGINSGDKVRLLDANGAPVELRAPVSETPNEQTSISLSLQPNTTGFSILHTTLLENASYGAPLASITVYFEQGDPEKYDLIYGRDLCAFDEAKLISERYVPERRWLAASKLGDGPGHGACLYAWEWANTNHTKKATRIEIAATTLGTELGYTVLAASAHQ